MAIILNKLLIAIVEVFKGIDLKKQRKKITALKKHEFQFIVRKRFSKIWRKLKKCIRNLKIINSKNLDFCSFLKKIYCIFKNFVYLTT